MASRMRGVCGWAKDSLREGGLRWKSLNKPSGGGALEKTLLSWTERGGASIGGENIDWGQDLRKKHELGIPTGEFPLFVNLMFMGPGVLERTGREKKREKIGLVQNVVVIKLHSS